MPKRSVRISDKLDSRLQTAVTDHGFANAESISPGLAVEKALKDDEELLGMEERIAANCGRINKDIYRVKARSASPLRIRRRFRESLPHVQAGTAVPAQSSSNRVREGALRAFAQECGQRNGGRVEACHARSPGQPGFGGLRAPSVVHPKRYQCASRHEPLFFTFPLVE